MMTQTFARLFFAPMILGFAAFIAAPMNGQNFQPGAVFVMTNAANANEVIAFSRDVDGSLVEQGRFGTGGRGSGGAVDPLHSQGSLVMSVDHRLLYAVNAGSGEISVFHVHGAHLQWLQVIPSGGSHPSQLQCGPVISTH